MPETATSLEQLPILATRMAVDRLSRQGVAEHPRRRLLDTPQVTPNDTKRHLAPLPDLRRQRGRASSTWPSSPTSSTIKEAIEPFPEIAVTVDIRGCINTGIIDLKLA